jgi:hypothetical protein
MFGHACALFRGISGAFRGQAVIDAPGLQSPEFAGHVGLNRLCHRVVDRPPWLVLVTYIVGIAEFVDFAISRPTFYVFPAWIAVVSIMMLIRLRPERNEIHTEAPES